MSLAGISEAAEHIGFRTLGVRIDIDTLKNEVPLPCIVPWKQRHFIVIYNIQKDKIQVADPGFGLIDYNLKDFCKGWFNGKNIDTNYTLVLETSPKFFESEEKYDKKDKSIYKFIWPYFRPYKRILFQVILGLFVGTLIQFAHLFCYNRLLIME